MSENPGKRVAQSFFGFQAVVENDDRSRPCTAQHALQAFVRLDAAIVILAQDIPHDDPETFAQRPDLRQPDATVGRSKQPGSDTAITFLNLAQIGTGRGVPAVDMMFRVIAYRVTAGLQALQQLGVLPDVFAHRQRKSPSPDDAAIPPAPRASPPEWARRRTSGKGPFPWSPPARAANERVVEATAWAENTSGSGPGERVVSFVPSRNPKIGRSDQKPAFCACSMKRFSILSASSFWLVCFIVPESACRMYRAWFMSVSTNL